MTIAPRIAVSILLFGTFSSHSASQCPTSWATGPGFADTNGSVYASSMWDPDGPGPQAPVLVIGGEFTVAGTVAATRIAVLDPATHAWSTLGGGFNDRVSCLLPLANGELIAGGRFTMANGAPAGGIARWNGTAWQPLGSGTNGFVDGLALMANGDLVACGYFTSAGGITVNHVARWNGTNWSSFGSGVSGYGAATSVAAVVVTPTGDLVIGGSFTTAGGTAAVRTARWNGTTWQAIGSGPSSWPTALDVAANGDIYVATQDGVERWTGSFWSGLLSGYDIRSLLIRANGDVVIGGWFQSILGQYATSVARWNGSSWAPVGPVLTESTSSSAVKTLTEMPNGELVAGAAKHQIHTNHQLLRLWNGTTWLAPSAGTNGTVMGVLERANGHLVAAGFFHTIGGTPANRIAEWDGSTWTALGTGVTGQLPWISQLLETTNGDLIAAGSFPSIGGTNANNIARWNGSSWAPLGNGLPARVDSLLQLTNGDLVAGGQFPPTRWNGSTWTPLAGGPSDAFAMLQMPDGSIVVGGHYTVQRWNGTSWTWLGGPNGLVRALAIGPNGDLVAGGEFTDFHGLPGPVARWIGGSSWAAFSSGLSVGSVSSMTSLPNGDLVAAGNQGAGGQLFRNQGGAWSPLGGAFDDTLEKVAMTPSGNLLVAGRFLSGADGRSPYLARLISTCPATSTSTAPGCSGPGPALHLTATLPWLGSTVRCSAGPFVPTEFAVAVVGVQAINQPLTQILAVADPGCVLLAQPDALVVLQPAAGQLPFQFALPPTPLTLVGAKVWLQVVGIDQNGSQWTGARASEAIELTAGHF